jgi:hypothetical protein
MSQFLFLASLLLSTENPCSQEKLLLIYGFETGLILHLSPQETWGGLTDDKLFRSMSMLLSRLLLNNFESHFSSIFFWFHRKLLAAPFALRGRWVVAEKQKEVHNATTKDLLLLVLVLPVLLL